ncbi:MAG: TlpA disulfide reductase family protein [Phycisphaerales bacterium]
MFTLVAMSALAPAVLAAPQEAVAPVNIEERIEAYQEAFQAGMEAGTLDWPTVQALANDALSGVDFSTLSMDQILQLHEKNILEYAGRTGDAFTRLESFADPDTATGAKAAMLRAMFAGNQSQDPRDTVKVLTAALEHKHLSEVMSDPMAQNFLFSLGQNPEPVLKGSESALLGFAESIDESIAPEAAVGFGGLWDAIMAAKTSDADDARREKIRTHFVEIGKAKVAQIEDERMAEWFKDSLKYLDGAAARGMLIDHEVPQLTFLWSSDPSITSMSDLRGKVVVLDFWATWCGPCIGSFPQVRDLVSHYEGYPVAVVGVTSPQGTFFGADGQRTDCEGAPEKEFELTPGFIDAKEITWTVVYSEENVFNPDFGIRGIPHVAIVDTKGVVRYNGLHPAVDPEKKHEYINGLLEEAGLPHPTEEAMDDADHGHEDGSDHDHE